MVFSDDVLLEVISDIIMFLLFTIVVMYLIKRDDKKMDLINIHYDKLLDNTINSISKRQQNDKEEIIRNISELSAAILNVLTGIEKVVEGVKAVETEVTRVTQSAKDISNGIGQSVSEMIEMTAQLKLSIKAVENLEIPISEISSRIDKMIYLIDIKNVEFRDKTKPQTKQNKQSK